MTRNTIALCIPAYNAEWCLPSLLQSAHDQELPFDQILVYNDFSSDNTARVAKENGATVVSGKTNVGCSAGKNALLPHCNCEWIHYHDADDILLPNFTRVAHKWIAKESECPDVVLFDYEYRDYETKELIARSDFRSEELKADPLRYAILNQINPFCGLYRRDKLLEVGGYDTDPEILYNEDVAFHCKLASMGFSFDSEKEVSIVNYRIGNSMSGGNQLKCLTAHFHVMRRLAKTHGDKYGTEISKKLWHASAGLAMHGDWKMVRQALQLANELDSIPPSDQSRFFRCIVQILGPYRAFKFRESMIRLLKPRLRRS